MSDTGAFSSYMWTGSLSIPAGQEATIPETFYMVFFEPLDDNELDLGLEVKYTVNPCVKYYVKNNFAIPVSESAVRNCVEEESGVEIVSATVDKYYVDDSCDPTTLTVTVKNTGEQKIIEVIVYEIYGTKVCSIHNPQQIMLRSGGQYSFDFIITGYGHSPGVRTIDISAYNYSDQQYKESASVDFYLREAGDDCCP